ncbi:MAG TPA: DUF4396 domain-containing protein [Verrucomicrobiae bacterium]|nr:DUF4396 domain-containing protein [Verrucomicrobiae bacterium]
MIPHWLVILSIASLALSGFCALVIVLDLLAGNSQHMWIMNIVWPVTALYAGPIAVWAYFKWGRLSSHHEMMQAKKRGEEMPSKKKPFWEMCSTAATHCGAGCTLGDIFAEWLLFAFPFVLFGHKLFATWVADFIAAFLLGIAFQYFTIKPMRNLSPGKGLARALQADTLSITFWQIGMYGWMAITTFVIFGHELEKNTSVFWFMMQIAMCVGFLTAFPVNAWLLKRGVKEKM